MKVTLINHSDSLGGASAASMRLLEALRAEGVDARMIVKRSTMPAVPYIAQIGGNVRDKICFLAERAHIFAELGFNRKNLFKVSTAECGLPVSRHPWIADADIVVINWINQGMMSLADIGRVADMGKPIVWIMHDMWPMTGICHLAGSCTNYERGCGRCPFLGARAGVNDLSAKTLHAKVALYARGDFRFVTVSNRLLADSKKSMLLKDKYVTTIHNPMPVDGVCFEPCRSRSELGLPDGRPLIMFCAARVDDPDKGLADSLDAVKSLQTNDFKPCLVLVGDIRDKNVLNGHKSYVTYLGPINDRPRLNDIFAHCDAVVSSSPFESLGYTLIEGMAAGATPVCYNGDGRDDIVSDGLGLAVANGDVNALADALRKAISDKADRRMLHDAAAARFGSAMIARRYIDLFNSILAKTNAKQ